MTSIYDACRTEGTSGTLAGMNAKTLLEANLQWAYHLPKGWHALYRRAAEALAKEAPLASIVGAKEKMGELRISLIGGNAQAAQIKSIACRASRRTCQECGGQGYLASDRYTFATLCSAHLTDKFGSRYEPVEDVVMLSFATNCDELVSVEPLEEQACRERPELLAWFLGDQR